jgi:hypothetical protein
MTETNQMEMAEEVQTTEVETKLKDRKLSWARLRRVDSLNLEAGRVSMPHSHTSNVCHINHLNLCCRVFCQSFILDNI